MIMANVSAKKIMEIALEKKLISGLHMHVTGQEMASDFAKNQNQIMEIVVALVADMIWN